MAGFAILRVALRPGDGALGQPDGAFAASMTRRGCPLLTLIFRSTSSALTPVLNSYVRAAESAADVFGLNAARQPDGFAQIALKLAEYRKLDPDRWRSCCGSTIPAAGPASAWPCSGRRR